MKLGLSSSALESEAKGRQLCNDLHSSFRGMKVK